VILGDLGVAAAAVVVAEVEVITAFAALSFPSTIFAAATLSSSLTILIGDASLLFAKKLVVSSRITNGASVGLDSSADFSCTMTMGDLSLNRSLGDFSLSIGIVRSIEEEEERGDLPRSIGITRSVAPLWVVAALDAVMEEEEEKEEEESRFWTSTTTTLGLGDVNLKGGEGGLVVRLGGVGEGGVGVGGWGVAGGVGVGCGGVASCGDEEAIVLDVVAC